MIFPSKQLICSKLATEAQEQGVKTVLTKAVEWRQWRLCGVFINKCEHVSHIVLIANFEQANVCWVYIESANQVGVVLVSLLQWRNWGGVLGAIAPPSRKKTTLFKVK